MSARRWRRFGRRRRGGAGAPPAGQGWISGGRWPAAGGDNRGMGRWAVGRRRWMVGGAARRREPPAGAEDEGAGARAGGRRRAWLLQRIPVFSRELCIDTPTNQTAAEQRLHTN